MSRYALWFVAALAVAGICWRFPLFHVVTIKQAQQEKAAATFNPKDVAEKFWNEKLLASLEQAVSAEVLLPALQKDASAARKQFSRSLGVSESYTYFLGGRGRVLTVSDDEITLAVTAGATVAEVSLQVGLLFNNAVRDGTGLLSVNDYPNSQDFNSISEALNRIIEERVQPPLRETAKVGVTIRFVGCAEVNDESSDLKPLKVIPIAATVE